MSGVNLWLSQAQAQVLEQVVVDALVYAEKPLERNLWIIYRTLLTARRTPGYAWLVQHESATSNECDK